MLGNHLKITVRNILKYKVFSFINMTGLAVGVACSLLAWLFVSYELSYDDFNVNADRIYRLASRAKIGDTNINQTGSSAETFRVFTAEFPEIESGVKFRRYGRLRVTAGGKTFFETNCVAADSTYFNIFTHPLVYGNPPTALAEPNTVVITKTAARKYFGREDVVGESLLVGIGLNAGDLACMVTGVCEELPENSHFHLNLLISMSSFPEAVANMGWSMNNFTTYLMLAEGSSGPVLEKKIADYMEEKMIEGMGADRYKEWQARGDFWEYYLQPLSGIHLDSDINGEFEANGNRNYVYMFMVISIVILVIACFNFMNLSTARSSLRAREVGIRKVVGSTRTGLIWQFLGESVFMSFAACAIAIGLVYALLPGYRSLVGREITFDLFAMPLWIPGLIAFAALLGLVSGVYPAFVLSSFRPVAVLKGRAGGSGSELHVRNALIVLQFSIVIFLIAGVSIVHSQMRYIQNKALGFDKEQVLVVDNPRSLGTGTNTFKDVLRKIPGVVSVSGSSNVPGNGFSNIGFGAKDVDKWFTLNMHTCDPAYEETMKLNLVQGRFFSPDHAGDSTAVVINAAALKLIGWEDPIGKTIYNGAEQSQEFRVIGVIEDYHYESLHQEVRPMALFFSGGYYNWTERCVSVRLQTDDVRTVVGGIEKAWNEFVPGVPFSSSFLDDIYEDLYRNEMQVRALFTIFSVLAVMIGCLGLFGLSAFVVDRKTREIGIRKVLGASTAGIVRQLNMDFLKIVLIANLFAWPAAWFVMSRWLENFAYRVDIGPGVFLLSGATAIAVAALTVSFQSVRAALADPVDSLKYE